jgi:predicted regulator of Ras-like GTPase activity (Roadblock/LC7/MglB family)
MKQILEELNAEVGVKGSIVLTNDGLVMAAQIGGTLDHDTVAANASTTLLEIRKALRAVGIDGFSKFICNSRFGKMVFVETGEMYLVVVLDKSINLDYTLMSVASAARKIRSAGDI